MLLAPDRPRRAVSPQRCLVCGAEQTFRFAQQGYRYYRCRSCGLISTLPVPDDETRAIHYAQRFEDGNYRVRREKPGIYDPVNRAYARLLRRELRKAGLGLEDASVLDVGAFTGEFVALLLAQGTDAYGVEVQAEAVAVAESKLPGRVIRADVADPALDSLLSGRHFDAVTLLAVIEHVPDPLGLLARAAKLLRPGGLLVLETPDSGSLLARVMGRFWPSYTPVEHIHLFSRRSLSFSLQSAGFLEARFRSHWKSLTPSYVYDMLETFGPSCRPLLRAALAALPRRLREVPLPFYGGEVLVTARKPQV
ncbi:MAG: methyltransferase domain-containing protein [Acidobacteriota bacterium]|nr:methyltransferase domain-containing protein [Acidobacteriota bacterium]MDQ5871739.1 methyltransferase domain-containing protein [Acidobacteriota bacterium]